MVVRGFLNLSVQDTAMTPGDRSRSVIVGDNRNSSDEDGVLRSKRESAKLRFVAAIS
jgi:hypothetical protein